jgi:tRNA (guanine-N(7)-)-methyltransferase subunit TRM82
MEVTLPYQALEICGRVLCAAQGKRIYTFSLTKGDYISGWSCTAGKTDASKSNSNRRPRDASESGLVLEAADGVTDGSSAKRRKLEPSGDDGSPDPAPAPEGCGHSETKDPPPTATEGAKGNRRGDQAGETPWVSLLKSTANGKYLVAVTSHDKALWVLEHDGSGQLTELSKR